MPRVHCPTGLDFAFLSKTTRPDSSTTHTEVSFWETSNPTYCFTTASESFGCDKSKVYGAFVATNCRPQLRHRVQFSTANDT
jgi:hypothetical protein